MQKKLGNYNKHRKSEGSYGTCYESYQGVQAIYGPKADVLNDVQDILGSGEVIPVKLFRPNGSNSKRFVIYKGVTEIAYSVADGQVIELEQVKIQSSQNDG